MQTAFDDLENLSEMPDVKASDFADEIVAKPNYYGLPAPRPELPVDENGMAKFKSVDEAVAFYVADRDHISEYMKIANDHDKLMKERMSKISMWLRDKGDELGIDSFKTQHGTAYRNVKVSYRVGDWTSFIGWVQRTENFQCLEKRVAKLATKEIHDDTGEIPPGIEYVAEVEFNVRRPSKKEQ